MKANKSLIATIVILATITGASIVTKMSNSKPALTEAEAMEILEARRIAQEEARVKLEEERKAREAEEIAKKVASLADESIPYSLRLDTKRILQARHAEALEGYKREMAAFTRVQKSRGVIVGMTPEEVRASSWGRPDRVNRTTSQWGVREQWVYAGGRSFLYFEDGKLNSIQN